MPREVAVKHLPSIVAVCAVLQAGCGRSPESFAEQVSGLDIPGGATVGRFTDISYGADSEDLFAEAVLEFDPEPFASLRSQALALGYMPVEAGDAAIPDSFDEAGMSMHGFSEAAAEITGPEAGLFLYRRDSPGSCALAVLDPGRRRLVVRAVII